MVILCDLVDQEECIGVKVGDVMEDDTFKQPEQPKSPATGADRLTDSLAARQVSNTSSRSSSRVSFRQSERSKYCLRRFIYRQSQQPDTTLFLPFWFYTYCCQTVLTASTMFFFFIMGSIILVERGSLQEVTVTYTADLLEKDLASLPFRFQEGEFSLDADLDGDVFLYYDLQLWANHRSFVESKDKRVIYNFLSVAVCTNADTRQWARIRRNDTSFLEKVEAAPGDALVPCGLISLSMFTDNFTLHRSTSAGWERTVTKKSGEPRERFTVRIQTDSSDITLSYDDKGFSKLQAPGEGESHYYILQNGAQIYSWLTPELMPHWKVWHRTPVGPKVRNLWAVIHGGLPKGTYRVDFLENSDIWHQWGVSEKNLVLATRNSFLGNSGALSAAGGVCLFLGFAEALALVFMLMAPRLHRARPSVVPEEVYNRDPGGVNTHG
eukprot:g6624.t1